MKLPGDILNLPAEVTQDPRRLFRFFLKDSIRDLVDFGRSDQSRGVPPPPIQKPVPEGIRRVGLVPYEEIRQAGLAQMPILEAIARRSSVRRYTDTPLSLAELSLLLWATQGVRHTMGETTVLRTVPSAGNRHALEAYVYVRRVESIPEGIYRYLPLGHELVLEREADNERDVGNEREEGALAGRVSEACRGQRFAGDCAATFIWTTIPYRMEWRYGLAAHKVIAIDAGHVGQNLYLACQAIGAGTCAIAAYDQEAMDRLLGVDGEEEFTVYVAPVGKLA